MNSIRCHLNPKVRLIPHGEEGFVLCPAPLKIWKVKRKALDLLSLCDGERTFGEILSLAEGVRGEVALSFLERLERQGVVRLERPWDQAMPPLVSIVVPVRNRAQEITECLESLLRLNYPRVEIIAVDDASEDTTPEQLSGFPVRAILMPKHIGQAACRNAALGVAKGEIVAFTDSDCAVDADWLAGLVPLFADPKVAAVGGLVAPLAPRSRLQRYEEVRSPLYQGRERREVGADSSPSYLPSCNLLVKRKVLEEAQGFDEGMALGEDVDLTWRICELGFKAVYSPTGRVGHRHRDRLRDFVARRALYASSEASLLRKHPRRRRLLHLPVALCLCLALLGTGIVLQNLAMALLAVTPLVAELAVKEYKLLSLGLRLPIGLLSVSTLRGYGTALHHLLKSLSRYYSLPLLLLGLVSPYLLALPLAVMLAPALVDYLLLRPALNPIVFSWFYVIEDLCYQAGVILGCLKERTVRPLLPRLRLV